MTDIDPDTNLPQLPEDHFWSIREHEIAVMKRIPAGEWSGWSKAPPNQEITPGRERESRVVVRIGGRLFKRETTGLEYRYRKGASSEWVAGAKYGEWETSCFGEKVYPVVVSPVTPDNILERTTEVYNEWQAKIAREKLYGNYPPKNRRHND